MFQDIFLYCATVDEGSFFMCNLEEFKLMADLIEDLPLSLGVKYKFCSAPVNTRSSRARVTFIKVIFDSFLLNYCLNDLIFAQFV